MNMMNHLNNTQVSLPYGYGAGCGTQVFLPYGYGTGCGKDAFDNRPLSGTRKRPSTSVRSDVDFKKPRFAERDSDTRIPLTVNRSKLSIPYKSELCNLFRKRRCYYGENCHYAHRASDIRGRVGINAPPVDECRYFAKGLNCPYGDDCHFLHKCVQKARSDKGLHRENDAITAVDVALKRNAGENKDRPAYLKTRLCHKWEMFGSCPYGVICTYAHGKAELRRFRSPAEMRNGYTSESTQPGNAASCEAGIKIAKKLMLKGKKCFLNWDIGKTSQIYADWIDGRQDFHVSFN